MKRSDIYDTLVKVNSKIDRVAARIDSLPPSLVLLNLQEAEELFHKLNQKIDQEGIT